MGESVDVGHGHGHGHGLSIPGDMLLSAVENVVYRMQCVVHEK
ncbi:hypothetical protein AVEN_174626-1, partial [Araneus ventricosus]